MSDNDVARCDVCMRRLLDKRTRFGARDVREVQPYSEIYGIHPKYFHFTSDGSKVPTAWAPIVTATSWPSSESVLRLRRSASVSQALRSERGCRASHPHVLCESDISS